MQSLGAWAGRDVLDVGCGTGFHLPLFAETARSVIGIEPHATSPRSPAGGYAASPHVTVLQASAADLPLPDASVDVMHARWAYFFGPGCEPGLAELDRVMRPGGRAFVIDNDPSRSTFGAWFRRGYPDVDHVEVERFWADQGWDRHPVDMAWTFDSREDLEAVVRIEFAAEVAEEILAGHEGDRRSTTPVSVWSAGATDPARGRSARRAGWSGVRRGWAPASGPGRRSACARARGAGSGPARRPPAPAAGAPRSDPAR